MQVERSPRFGFPLLWLSGNALRITLLAVAPVLPLIHADLHLSETAVGALTALPVLLLGLAAVPGSLVIARFGARRALIAGLLLVAAASALRGAVPVALADASTAMLFAMTFVMGVGIAIMQPALPALVARWFPARVGLATATYSNGLLFGEMLAAALTLPVVLPLSHGNWRATFVWWSVPIFATALLVAAVTPSEERAGGPLRAWMPDWRDPLVWRLGIMQTGFSSIYFASNAFIPDFLRARGHAELIGAALTSLNAAQLPASFGLLFVAHRLVGRGVPLAFATVAALAGMAALVTLPPAGMLAGAATIGFFGAVLIVLVLALPALYAGAHDAHRLASAMFAIGYTMAFVLSLAGGALWDATHVALTAFVPAAAGGCAVLIGALTLPRSTPRAANENR